MDPKHRGERRGVLWGRENEEQEKKRKLGERGDERQKKTRARKRGNICGNIWKRRETR